MFVDMRTCQRSQLKTDFLKLLLKLYRPIFSLLKFFRKLPKQFAGADTRMNSIWEYQKRSGYSAFSHLAKASPEGSKRTRDPKTILYDEEKELRVLSKEKTNFIGFPGVGRR